MKKKEDAELHGEKEFSKSNEVKDPNVDDFAPYYTAPATGVQSHLERELRHAKMLALLASDSDLMHNNDNDGTPDGSPRTKVSLSTDVSWPPGQEIVVLHSFLTNMAGVYAVLLL